MHKTNINVWSVIQVMLARNNRTQTDLAKHLNMTCAAVTQIKNGTFKLSGEKLESVCNFLHATTEEKNELYSKIVNARFFGTEKVKVEML